MNVNCEKSALKNSLSQVMKAITGNSTIPMMSNILFKASGSTLELTATDNAITITSVLEAEVLEEGKTTCSAKQFDSIVSNLPIGGKIEIETKREGFLVINSQFSNFELPTLPAAEFPEIRKPAAVRSMTMTRKDFTTMINLVAVGAAASNSESRPILTGLMCAFGKEHATMVATNGLRLAKMEASYVDPPQEACSIVVKAKPMLEIAPFIGKDEGNVEISIGDSQLALSVPGLSYYCRLLEGEFPDYRRVMPHEFQRHCEVSRTRFVDAIRRTRLMAVDKDLKDLLRFQFEPDRLVVTSNTPNVGSAREELPINFTGEPLVINFNASYILDPIRQFETDDISLDMQDACSSLVMRPLGLDSYTYVCMPIRPRI